MTRAHELILDQATTDPVWFARNVLGVEPWGKQQRILRLAASNPEGAVRLAVRSCHGSGKSWVLAVLLIWFTACHEDSIAVVTANTWEQAMSTVWAEVRKLHANSKVPLGGEMLKTGWTLGPKWFAHVLSPARPDSASGLHAPHVLQIVDESSGLTAGMAEAFEGNMSSGRVILVYSGNPLRPSGPFYEAFRGKIADEWDHLHMSAFDLPGNVAGLTTKDWIDLRRKEWGEGSPAWQSRVLGEFPDAAVDALIALSLIEEAEARDHTQGGRRKMGVDTARFGGDENVFIVRDNGGVLHVEGHRSMRETETAGTIINLIKDWKLDPTNVNVDNTGGYGGGAVDILKEQDILVNPVIFSESASDPDQFKNVRAEMYWNLMLALRDEEFSLKGAGSALGGQLAAISKKFDGKGRIQLEAKEKVKARVGRSPDHADALALTFVPPKPPPPEPQAVLL